MLYFFLIFLRHIDYDSAEEEDKFAPTAASKQKTLPRTASTKAFTFTKEGYKSFVGGWVECFTEEGTLMVVVLFAIFLSLKSNLFVC